MISEPTRLEKRGVFRRHVRLLAVMDSRFVALAYSGSPEKGWGVFADCESLEQASGTLWDERRTLERDGFRRVEWVDEPAFDRFIEALATDSIE